MKIHPFQMNHEGIPVFDPPEAPTQVEIDSIVESLMRSVDGRYGQHREWMEMSTCEDLTSLICQH